MKLLGHPVLAGTGAEGERIRIEGQVFDGDGAFVEDALIEIWQADARGRYPAPGAPAGFTGFGRVVTDFSSGKYWFETIKPGQVPDPEGELQAPHLVLVIQARGMLRPVFTRLYFGDEEEANSRDLILGMVPHDRRPTLMAQLTNGEEHKVYRFDVKLQGENETVFFDF
jgi:protocatechuate 3,4-dioxygenase alpha subunit